MKVTLISKYIQTRMRPVGVQGGIVSFCKIRFLTAKILCGQRKKMIEVHRLIGLVWLV